MTRGRRADSTFSLVGATPLGFPIIEMPSAAAALNMLNDARTEIGLSGPAGSRIADEQDQATLISVGLHGVNEAILVVPTVLRDPDGNETLLMVAYDGTRRLEAAKRVQVEVTGCSPEAAFLAVDHLTRSGTPEFRNYDHDAVTHIRRGLLFGDHRGGTWIPAGNNPSEDSLLGFAASRIASDMQARTMARVRTIRANVLIGVIPTSLSDDADNSPSPLLAVTNAKVRSLHIEESSQKQWSEAAQRYKAAEEAISRIQKAFTSGTHPTVPVSSAQLTDLMDRSVPVWGAGSPDANVPDGPVHPIRLGAKLMATFTCTDQDGYGAATEALRMFGIAVSGKNARENRSQVAVNAAELCLFPLGETQGTINRISTAIERAFRSSVFYDTVNHPSGLTDPWWKHLDDSVDVLVDGAKAELAAFTAGTVQDTATKWFGPHGRALAALGVFAQTASPLLRSSSNTSQLTLNGLGGTRGETKATPDQVILNLLSADDRIELLGEMVAAALGATLRIPINTLSGTGAPLTEADLRGKDLGWDPAPDPDPDPAQGAMSLDEEYEWAWQRIDANIDIILEVIADLSDESRQTPGVARGDTLLGVLESRGRALDPDQDTSGKVLKIQHFLMEADTYARLNRTS